LEEWRGRGPGASSRPVVACTREESCCRPGPAAGSVSPVPWTARVLREASPVAASSGRLEAACGLAAGRRMVGGGEHGGGRGVEAVRLHVPEGVALELLPVRRPGPRGDVAVEALHDEGRELEVA